MRSEIESAVSSWMSWLDAHKGARNELRYKDTKQDILAAKATVVLKNSFYEGGLGFSSDQIALLAATFCHAENVSSGPDNFGRVLAQSDVREGRFKRLVTMDTREDLLPHIRRMVMGFFGSENPVPLCLASDLYFWDSCKEDWAEGYYREVL